jgi:hypothetical protein
MEQEEPEGPLLVPSGVIPLGDQLGDMVVTELSEMKALHIGASPLVSCEKLELWLIRILVQHTPWG